MPDPPGGAVDEALLVVMVNYDLVDDIERVLTADWVAGTRVMLVDNASQPERMRELASRHGTGLLLLDRNHGFAGGVNRALAQAGRADQVLLLNPDVELTGEALASMRHALVAGDLTAVTPLLVNRDGSLQVGTAGGPVSLAGFVAYFLGVSHVAGRAAGVFHTRRQLAAGLTPRWLCMACLLLRGDAFVRYGPIPEDELVYAEDVAWGVAASRAGARFGVVADVRARHHQGAAGASWRWRGALARLARHEQGPVRGRLSAGAMRLGLAARSLVAAGGIVRNQEAQTVGRGRGPTRADQ